MDSINFLSTNVVIVSTLLAILVLRLRIKRKSGCKWMLSYPVSIKILSVVGLLFVYTGVSVLVELTPGIAAKLLVIVLSLPAGVLAFMAAAEVFASETSYDDSVLYQCSPWRRSVTVPFDDVVRIKSAMLWIQYAVYSRAGHVIKVCKWTEQAEEVLGYAQEALENDTGLAEAAVNS